MEGLNILVFTLLDFLRSVKCTKIFECKTLKMWFTLQLFFLVFFTLFYLFLLFDKVSLTENLHKYYFEKVQQKKEVFKCFLDTLM